MLARAKRSVFILKLCSPCKHQPTFVYSEVRTDATQRIYAFCAMFTVTLIAAARAGTRCAAASGIAEARRNGRRRVPTLG